MERDGFAHSAAVALGLALAFGVSLFVKSALVVLALGYALSACTAATHLDHAERPS